MENFNKNAVGELIGRIGCGAVVVAIIVLIIIEICKLLGNTSTSYWLELS